MLVLRWLLLIALAVSTVPGFGMEAAETNYFVSNFNAENSNKLDVWQSEADVNVFFKRIEKLCKASGHLWIFGDPTTYTCSSLENDLPPHECCRAVIATKPAIPHHEELMLLMSTKPFPKQEWSKREATEDEFARYSRLSNLKGKHRRVALTLKNMTIMQVPSKALKFVILPYIFKPSECEPGDECEKDVVKYAIFLDDKNHPRKLYETSPPIKLLGDIDGDGVPELLQEPYCDGSCFELVKFYPKEETLLQYTP